MGISQSVQLLGSPLAKKLTSRVPSTFRTMGIGTVWISATIMLMTRIRQDVLSLLLQCWLKQAGNVQHEHCTR